MKRLLVVAMFTGMLASLLMFVWSGWDVRWVVTAAIALVATLAAADFANDSEGDE